MVVAVESATPAQGVAESAQSNEQSGARHACARALLRSVQKEPTSGMLPKRKETWNSAAVLALGIGHAVEADSSPPRHSAREGTWTKTVPFGEAFVKLAARAPERYSESQAQQAPVARPERVVDRQGENLPK